MQEIHYNIPDILCINAELPQVCRMEAFIQNSKLNICTAHENGKICKFSNFKTDNWFISKSSERTLLDGNHNKIITQIRFFDNKLITCSLDKTIKIWNLNKSNKCIFTHEESDIVWDVLFFNSNTIIYGTEKGKFKIFDLKKQKVIKEFVPFEDFINDLLNFKSENKQVLYVEKFKDNFIFIGGYNNFIIYDIKNDKRTSKNEYLKSDIKFLDSYNNRIFISSKNQFCEFNYKTKQCKDFKIPGLKGFRIMNGAYHNNWFLFNDFNNEFFVYNLLNQEIVQRKKIYRNIHKIINLNNKTFLLTSI